MGSRTRLAGVAGGLVLTMACGSSGGSGANVLPAVPSGAVVSIQVNSQGPTIFLGAPETFTAIATYTSGGTQTITAGTWSTDTATIAVAEAGTGKITGVGNGDVTVSVDFQGVRGSKKVRVLPNYSGIWIGSYTVTNCTQTSAFADQDFCSNFAVGRLLPLYFQFSQTADALTGFTALGQLASTTFNATVGADGSVTFTTQIFVGTTEIDLTWSLTCVVVNVINGSVNQTWQDSTLTGQMLVAGDIHGPAKQSASTASVRRAADRRPGSLLDVLAAVRR